MVGRLVQNNKVAVLSQASFAVARQSQVQVSNELQHKMDFPQKPNLTPLIPKITPNFLGHFDLAQTKGGLPFTGSKSSDIHGWMRFENQPSDLSDAYLVALIDTWAPTVLQLLRQPAMASTMSWNLEFMHLHQKMSGSDWSLTKPEQDKLLMVMLIQKPTSGTSTVL